MKYWRLFVVMAAFAFLARAKSLPADPVRFTIDTAHSNLKVTGTVTALKAQLAPQQPGSDTATYFGAVMANLTAGNIQFPGGSTVTANNFVGAALTPDATANYGMKATIIFTTAQATVINLVFDTTSGNLAVASNGTFASNTGVTATVTSGTIDYIGPSTGSGSLVGSSGANQATTASTIAIAGQTQTLTIPIKASIQFTVNSTDDSTATFTGQLVATRTLVTPPVAYWQGDLDPSWSTLQPTAATNWKTDAMGSNETLAVPGAVTDVYFTTSEHGANLATTLGANYSIKGLTFTSDATSATSIDGTNTLTLGAHGLAVQSGAAAMTINCPVVLGASQTWSSDSSNPVTVDGSLTVGANSLVKAGSSVIVLAGPQSFGNGAAVHVSGGTLRYNSSVNAAAVGTGVSVSVADGAQLELANSGSALYDGTRAANVANDSQLAGAGLLVSGTNQRVGKITGGGDTTVSAGGSLTANSIQQNLLAIGGDVGNSATVRIAASDASGNPLADAASPSFASLNLAASGALSPVANLLGGGGTLQMTEASSLSSFPSIPAGAPTAVPEPASLALAAIAAATAFLIRSATRNGRETFPR